jgi:hypothetical protein
MCSILTRDHRFLNDLLLEAKKNYLAAEEHNISIFLSDSSVSIMFIIYYGLTYLICMAGPIIGDMWLRDRNDLFDLSS